MKKNVQTKSAKAVKTTNNKEAKMNAKEKAAAKAKALRNAEKAAKMAQAKKNLPPETKKLLTGNTKKSKIVRAEVLKTAKTIGSLKTAKSKREHKAILIKVGELKAKLHKMFEFKQQDLRAVRELAKAHA